MKNWLRHIGTVCLLAALSTGLFAQQNLIQINPNEVTVTETQVNNNLQPPPKIDTTTPKYSNDNQQIPTSYLTPLGRPLCGGIVNGQLQPSCGYAKAALIGKARSDCPPGTIFDIGNWACYKCPSGYGRTANNVAMWDACSKKVPDQLARATYNSKVRPAPPAPQPAGAILDARNGGEYWSCPSGLGRTMSAIDAWDACGMIGREAKPATFLMKACANGWYDPRNGGECWSCPAGFGRTGAAVNEWNACLRTEDLKPAEKMAALTCETGDHFDFVDGGTCWRCPKESVRSLMSAKGPQACDYRNKIKWKTPAKKQPGLFGLDGAEEIALEILTKRKEIDELVMEAAKKRKGNPQQWIDQEWATINKDPAQSAILTAAVLARVMDAALAPVAQRTPAEARLIAAVEAQMRGNRIFIADQAQQYFDNWVAAVQARHARDNKGMSSMFVALGTPPDVDDLVMDAISVTAGFGAMGAGMWVITTGPNFLALVPHARLTGEALKALTLAADGVLKTASGTITTAGSGLGAVASSAAGPLVIISGAAIIAQVVITDTLNAERVRLTTKNNLEVAQQPVNLGVLLQSQNGAKDLMFHWGMLTNTSSRPSAAFFTRVAAIAAEKGIGPVTFDIVSEANTCLQAAGSKLSLVACTRANPTRWIAKGSTLVPLGNEGMCLSGTAAGPALAQCQPTNPQWMLQQQWRLEASGQIFSAAGSMLVAKGAEVTVQTINPTLPGSKWKALTK